MTSISESVSQNRIAILLPDLRGGGVERMRILLEREFTAKRYKVDFVLMRKTGELLQVLEPHVSVFDLDVTRFRNLLIPLVRYLKCERPDALLAAMWPLTCYAVWAVKLARVQTRVVISDHNTLSKTPQAGNRLSKYLMQTTIRLSYPWADARVCVSEGVAEDVAQLSSLTQDQINVIYNPAARGALPSFPTNDPRVNSWLKAKMRIISVGSFKAQKDFVTLLHAFARVSKRENASLLILGEGKLRGELETLADSLQIQNKVTMPGFVADPYPYYVAANLFVLSSRYEGFGNVIVESMECGLPIVSTDCESGPREILDHGRYGKLVPVGDADALVSAILAALQEAPNPERQKARASEFSIEKAARAYLALLDPEGEATSDIEVEQDSNH